jgi:hypothetical protein
MKMSIAFTLRIDEFAWSLLQNQVTRTRVVVGIGYIGVSSHGAHLAVESGVRGLQIPALRLLASPLNNLPRKYRRRPMHRKVRRRWKSKFARFIQAYGVESPALQLDVRSSAIYHWIRGATTPRPAHAATPLNKWSTPAFSLSDLRWLCQID